MYTNYLGEEEGGSCRNEPARGSRARDARARGRRVSLRFVPELHWKQIEMRGEGERASALGRERKKVRRTGGRGTYLRRRRLEEEVASDAALFAGSRTGTGGARSEYRGNLQQTQGWSSGLEFCLRAGSLDIEPNSDIRDIGRLEFEFGDN